MQKSSNDRSQVEKLLPLVRSIGRELSERLQAVSAMEERMATLLSIGSTSKEIRLITAEASSHYRAIRQSRHELGKLGCSVIGEQPLTVRVCVNEEGHQRSLLWQMGNKKTDSLRNDSEV